MKSICYVDNCDSKVLAKGVCSRHYKHLYRHGKILERTIYDKNEIVIFESFAEMKLYNKDGIYVTSTLIDIEDVEKVSKYKWHLNDNGYVRNKILNEYIHRFIMKPKNDKDIDHINGDTLDNRKFNLRECFHYENNRNTNKTNSNTGIKGVYYDERTNKYYSTVNSQGSRYVSAYYGNIGEALECREIMELYLHKEYSPKYKYLTIKHGDINDDKFNSVVSSKNEYRTKG